MSTNNQPAFTLHDVYTFREIIQNAYKSNRIDNVSFTNDILSLANDPKLKIQGICGSVERLKFTIVYDNSINSMEAYVKIIGKVKDIIRENLISNFDNIDIPPILKDRFKMFVYKYDAIFDYAQFNNVIDINL